MPLFKINWEGGYMKKIFIGLLLILTSSFLYSNDEIYEYEILDENKFINFMVFHYQVVDLSNRFVEAYKSTPIIGQFTKNELKLIQFTYNDFCEKYYIDDEYNLYNLVSAVLKRKDYNPQFYETTKSIFLEPVLKNV